MLMGFLNYYLFERHCRDEEGEGDGRDTEIEKESSHFFSPSRPAVVGVGVALKLGAEIQ